MSVFIYMFISLCHPQFLYNCYDGIHIILYYSYVMYNHLKILLLCKLSLRIFVGFISGLFMET